MIIDFLLLFLSSLQFFLFLRVIWSWFPNIPKGRLYFFLADLTDPLLDIVKKVPHQWGMVDFSPLLAFFLLDFLRFIIVTFL
ncbi:MAG: YggT family protein [Candidatus Peregrinibacteria bacterium]